MARLKFYQNEWKIYQDYCQVKYNQKDALKICNKLNRHFKVEAWFRFSNNTIGQAYRNGLIDLPKKDISLAMICHEVGHLLSRKKYGYKGKGHNKRLAKTNKIIFRYAIRYLPINTLLKINNQLLLEHKR
jgi:hypothetical protein